MGPRRRELRAFLLMVASSLAACSGQAPRSTGGHVEASRARLVGPVVSPEHAVGADFITPSHVAGGWTGIACAATSCLAVWVQPTRPYYYTPSADITYEMRAVRTDLEGAPLEVTSRIVAPFPTYGGEPTAVASNGTDFLIVWSDGTAVLSVRMSGADGSFLDASPVVVTPGVVAPYRVSVTSNGADYLAAWVSTDSPNVVRTGRISAASGQPLDPPDGVLVSTAGATGAITVDSDGTQYLVGWVDNRPLNGVQMARVDYAASVGRTAPSAFTTRRASSRSTNSPPSSSASRGASRRRRPPTHRKSLPAPHRQRLPLPHRNQLPWNSEIKI